MNYGGSSASGSISRGNAAGQLRGSRNSMSRGDRIPKGFETAQLQQFTPEQMDLFQQMFGQVSPDSELARLASGDEEIFNQIEAPAMRQFQELTGQNASRFSNAGMGARRGSGFQNQQNQYTTDFATQLASNRQNLMRQARQDLFSMSHELLGQRPYERSVVEKQQKDPNSGSGWKGLIGAGVGATGGFFAGGPAGALTGAQLGYKVGSSF